MTVIQFVSIAADLIAAVLMIRQLYMMKDFAAGKKENLRLFFKPLCVVVLLIAFFNLLKMISDVQMGGFTVQDFGKLSETDKRLWYITEVLTWIADIFLAMVFLFFWIKNLSMFLFGDRDYLKRKSWIGFTPLIASAVVSAVSVPVALMSQAGFVFFVVFQSVSLIISLVYLLLSLWLLNEHKKQNGYLRFFNPWTFFVPVFAGWILQEVFSLEFAALGSALGVVLLYASIVAEDKYIDAETGYYNKSVIDYLRNLADKNEYNPLSAMTFTVDDPSKIKDFALVLKKQLPQNCEPIRTESGRIVVLTGVPDKSSLYLVTEDVKDGFEVEATCTLKKKKESVKDFMERVL